MKSQSSLSYRDAGVNIDTGNLLVERIKPIAARTSRKEIFGGIGGFAALCEIPLDRYRHPLLVSGTDGVGTKLKLALSLKKHHTIGIDLVAMCVNDVLTCGAEPLFFLDYYATGILDVEVATEVITGIGKGCELAGASLVGGETAEMPGMYPHGEYDLAGFCVGIVEKSALIDGSQVQASHMLIGLASSGPHSNGYSLIRKLIEVSHTSLDSDFYGRTLGDVLLEPTRIYVKPILQLMKHLPISALVHITGGGLLENIPRVLPVGKCAYIHPHAWPRPPIFDWLQTQGNIEESEMYRTFNCGIGMVIALAPEHLDAALSFLHQEGETAWVIGKVDTHPNQKIVLQDAS